VGPASDDEAQLAARAQAGDEAAFTALVRLYQGPVRSLCRRILGDAEGDDAAQETFVRAFTHLGDFDPSRPLAPWLLTIARRLCLDKRRRAAVRAGPELDAERTSDPGPSLESTAAARHDLAVVGAALRELPEPQQEALVLFHVEGLAYKEIAGVLSVPIGTVMTWLHRGRAALKARLEPRGGIR
jgi:RNA polymerase sigma-70 factor, ECF subfamily